MAAVSLFPPGKKKHANLITGTGTPAGDPQEAEAISTAFFSNMDDQQDLYVGSIKTVVGHTEGTAGIAGLLKCSLAVQHGVIPPNMLLEKLSPRVEPFCKHLRVAKKATPWPAVPQGQPRRASVNSFGMFSLIFFVSSP